MLSIGLMSGTSMDGIDAALLETNGEDEILSCGYTAIDYAAEFKILLKAAEFATRKMQGNLDQVEKNFQNFYTHILQVY